MIGYLLRELPEAEWEALEGEFFADPALLARLEAVEHDLIEAYVCGKLTATHRAKFEQAYLNSPQRREKVEFYRALARALPLATQPISSLPKTEASLWRPKFLFSWRMPRLVAVTGLAVVLLFGGVWLAQGYRQLRRKAAESERERTLLVQRENELRARIAVMHDRNVEIAAELEKARRQLADIAQPKPSSVEIPAFAWTLSGLRSSNEMAERLLIIPTEAKSVRLTFRLTNSGYNLFRLELRSGDGQLIWSRSGLKAKKNSVTLLAPASGIEQARSLVISGRNLPVSGVGWYDMGVFPVVIVRR